MDLFPELPTCASRVLVFLFGVFCGITLFISSPHAGIVVTFFCILLGFLF
jgi:uncharacterized membrane protein YczE